MGNAILVLKMLYFKLCLQRGLFLGVPQNNVVRLSKEEKHEQGPPLLSPLNHCLCAQGKESQLICKWLYLSIGSSLF